MSVLLRPSGVASSPDLLHLTPPLLTCCWLLACWLRNARVVWTYCTRRLITLRMEELEVLDQTLNYWRNERSRYTLTYAQLGMIDLSLSSVQSQVEETVRAVSTDLSQQIQAAEGQSAARFNALTNVVHNAGASIQNSLNSMAATQLTNQAELQSSLGGLREQNSQLAASLSSHSNAITATIRNEAERTRLDSAYTPAPIATLPPPPPGRLTET